MTTKLSQILHRPLITSAVVALIAGGGFYYAIHDSRPSQAATPTAPPVPVVVHTLAAQKVRVWSAFSGRLHAVAFPAGT